MLCVAMVGALTVRPAPNLDLSGATEPSQASDPDVCQISNVRLNKVDATAMDADTSAILQHVGKALGKTPSEQTMKSVYHLSRSGVGCLDGRSDEAILSAPGGDLGEFILALKVLEDTAGRRLSQFDVDTLLVNTLAVESRQAFRACTDVQALEKLFKASGLGQRHDLTLLKNPSATLRETILKQLAVPDNVGDEHIRLMLLHPSLYQVRRELTGMAMKSFFRVMWNELGVPLSPNSYQNIASKLDLTVFEGNHAEDAVVSVLASDKCDKNMLPIAPASGNHEIRLYHPKALAVTRYQLAHIIRDQAVTLGLLGNEHKAFTVEDFANRVKDIGETLFLTTVEQLSISYGSKGSLAGYPRYELSLPSGCCPDHFRMPGSAKIPLKFEEKPAARNRREVSSICTAGSVAFSKSEWSSPEDKLRLDGFSIRQVGAHFQVASGAPFEFVDPREWGVNSVDSRTMESSLAVPGSSVGQFAIVLAMIQNRFKKTLDVQSILTNYVLAMKAPSFTYSVDVDTLFTLCGDLPECPNRNLPLEEKLAQLTAIFSRPSNDLKQRILGDSAGASIGDPFLRFVVTDMGISRPHIEGSHLGEVEKLILKALQQSLSAAVSDEKLQQWRLTKSQWDTLKGLFTTFQDYGTKGGAASPARQHERVRQAIQECIRGNRQVIDESKKTPEDADQVFTTCRDVLRRAAVLILDEDGDKSTDIGDLELKRSTFKTVLPSVIKAFFSLLWGEPGSLYKPYATGIAAKMDLIVIEGHATGHAFVQVKLADVCNQHLSPLLTPFRASTLSSVWVYHEAAARAYRADVATFLKSFVPKISSKNEEILGSASDFMEEMMHRFVSENLYDIPVYDMVFAEGCCPTMKL